MNRFLDEFSPNELTRNKTKQMLQNLYKDWGKELDFRLEYANNKALAGGGGIKSLISSKSLLMDLAY